MSNEKDEYGKDGDEASMVDMLELTARIVADRMSVYGSPKLNHDRIARLWNAYLSCIEDRDEGNSILPHDVAICMMLVKVARLSQTPQHYDSWKDLAGYSAVGWVSAFECDEEEDNNDPSGPTLQAL